MTSQCPSGITTLVKTKGLQKGDEVGFLKEACEFLQARGYNGRGRGRTQSETCVAMSSFWSQAGLQSSPSILVPVLGPLQFRITVPSFHCSWVIIIQVSGQENGISCCHILLKRQKGLNPREAGRARDGGKAGECTPFSWGSRHDSQRRRDALRLSSRREIEIWLFMQMLACIPFSLFKENWYQDISNNSSHIWGDLTWKPGTLTVTEVLRISRRSYERHESFCIRVGDVPFCSLCSEICGSITYKCQAG